MSHDECKASNEVMTTRQRLFGEKVDMDNLHERILSLQYDDVGYSGDCMNRCCHFCCKGVNGFCYSEEDD